LSYLQRIRVTGVRRLRLGPSAFDCRGEERRNDDLMISCDQATNRPEKRVRHSHMALNILHSFSVFSARAVWSHIGFFVCRESMALWRFAIPLRFGVVAVELARKKAD
jgi:hypothetical protein